VFFWILTRDVFDGGIAFIFWYRLQAEHVVWKQQVTCFVSFNLLVFARVSMIQVFVDVF